MEVWAPDLPWSDVGRVPAGAEHVDSYHNILITLTAAAALAASAGGCSNAAPQPRRSRTATWRAAGTMPPAVPAELVEGTTIIGPPGLVRDRLAAYREAGITLLNIRPLGPEPERTIARVRELMD